MQKLIILAALIAGLAAFSQPKVAVQIYSGSELLNVIHLLVDSSRQSSLLIKRT